ncbi:MAG: efflux RND transporter periplasmic adaptor subunit [Candidatus Kapaibacterium sp.]|nr:MAG: efflux RND transporter periplasmic adaptor subunit [Candidatus Kapabacteria bacterium]
MLFTQKKSLCNIPPQAAQKLLLMLLSVLTLFAQSCTKDEQSQAKQPTTSTRTHSKGDLLIMNRSDADKFPLLALHDTAFAENLNVTARAVAETVSDRLLSTPLVVFEAAEIAQIYSSYTKSKATFEKAVKQYERVQELLAGNAASGRELLEARTERNQAEAELREAESKMYQNEFNPAKLEAMRLGSVLMMCDVPESRTGDVSMGELVELEFTSFAGEIFKGKVTDIANAIDPQTRTVKVSIELHNPKNRIKIGMFAKARIERNTIKAISIPHEALVSADAKSFVFVRLNDSTFERRQITVSADNGVEYAVKSGLRVGERVVIENAILLKGLSFKY